MSMHLIDPRSDVFMIFYYVLLPFICILLQSKLSVCPFYCEIRVTPKTKHFFFLNAFIMNNKVLLYCMTVQVHDMLTSSRSYVIASLSLRRTTFYRLFHNSQSQATRAQWVWSEAENRAIVAIGKLLGLMSR